MIVDMSPKAITDRLRLASQLAALCRELGKARLVEPTSNSEGPQNDDQGARNPETD